MEITYDIVYLEDVVKKHIPSLSMSAKKATKIAIEQKLTFDPISFGKPLQYSLKGHRRLRVGDYRVVYRIEPKLKREMMIAIMHRKDIYKDH